MFTGTGFTDAKMCRVELGNMAACTAGRVFKGMGGLGAAPVAATGLHDAGCMMHANPCP